MNKRILIIEDEPAIADIVAFNLQREGFTAERADNGDDGLKMALKGSYDLVLLDVMLPNIDGFEVLKRLREKNNAVPVIMLTAREEEADKVFGLDLGADDYITKPFSLKELLARVKANVRRGAVVSGANANDDNKMSFANLCIYPERHEVTKNGTSLDLTAREYDLLMYLAKDPGRVVSREELMEKVWGYEFYGDLRAVDVAVRRLREKVEDDSAAPVLIITKRGMGYYFNANS